MTPAPAARAARRWTTPILAVVILAPACAGFTKKFLEFLALVGDEEGAFAVVPVLNYLLAGVGFLLLFLWAVLHGMFRDLERPKRTLLTNEALLDAEAADERDAWKEE